MNNQTIAVLMVIFTLLAGTRVIICTLNLNLAQLEYVADHLKPEDCRKLVAALHDPNFELTTNVDVAKWRVPQDVSCLKLLLHWNSEPGEGRGETHLVLTHRLEQLGHSELADWLSKSVFHQLGRDSQRAIIDNPFKQLLNESRVKVKVTEEPPTESTDDNWLPIDVIMSALIFAFLAVTVIVLSYVCWRLCYKKFCNIDHSKTARKETWIKMSKISQQEDGKPVLVYSDVHLSSESEEDM